MVLFIPLHLKLSSGPIVIPKKHVQSLLCITTVIHDTWYQSFSKFLRGLMFPLCSSYPSLKVLCYNKLFCCVITVSCQYVGFPKVQGGFPETPGNPCSSLHPSGLCIPIISAIYQWHWHSTNIRLLWLHQ